MAKILCWDLEIRDPVEGRGWEAAKAGECGISALVVSDSETRRFHTYDEHSLDAAIDHLNSADLLVGFNTIDFDCRVVQGVSGRYITVPQYDILAVVWKSIGKRRKGCKLTELSQATLEMGKSGSGEFATALVAAGRFGELFDYCINDVHLVKELFNHIQDTGMVIDAFGNEIEVPRADISEYA